AARTRSSATTCPTATRARNPPCAWTRRRVPTACRGSTARSSLPAWKSARPPAASKAAGPEQEAAPSGRPFFFASRIARGAGRLDTIATILNNGTRHGPSRLRPVRRAFHAQRGGARRAGGGGPVHRRAGAADHRRLLRPGPLPEGAGAGDRLAGPARFLASRGIRLRRPQRGQLR